MVDCSKVQIQVHQNVGLLANLDLVAGEQSDDEVLKISVVK